MVRNTRQTAIVRRESAMTQSASEDCFVSLISKRGTS
jgi:hypothetical protein